MWEGNAAWREGGSKWRMMTSLGRVSLFACFSLHTVKRNITMAGSPGQAGSREAAAPSSASWVYCREVP